MSWFKPTLARVGSALLFHSGILTLLRPFFNRLRLRTEAGRLEAPYLKRSRARNLQILAYHRVHDDPDPFFAASPVRWFERQMEYLASAFQVLSLEDAVERMQARDLPDNALVITFDDGYRDNYLNALPILREFALPATVFLTTGAIGSERVIWHERVFNAFRKTASVSLRGYPRASSEYALGTVENKLRAQAEVLDFLRAVDETERSRWIDQLDSALGVSPLYEDPGLMLSWPEVVHMHRAGISMGSHTVTHPILSRLPDERARQEILESKRAIERAIDVPVRTFAYPNGGLADFSEANKECLRVSGYRSAVTMIFGVNEPGDDLFALRRISPWARSLEEFAARLNFYKLIA